MPTCRVAASMSVTFLTETISEETVWVHCSEQNTPVFLLSDRDGLQAQKREQRLKDYYPELLMPVV